MRAASRAALAVVAAWIATSFASPSAVAAPSLAAPAGIDDRVRVGSLRVSQSARERVRGDRPEQASIHVAWAPPAEDPDRADRESLAAFERASLPQSGQTIVETPPDAHAWMRKLALPALPVRWNRRTVEYLRYFKDDAQGRAMMRAWMRRAGRYETRMRKILRQHDVPDDLVMVVLAESGFNPKVRSPVGAAGPWQFMEATGSVYGLAKDYWVDERLDVDKSTHAAALYLADLRVRFGSWELALAAYNAGYGLVMTAVERANTNNFWALCDIESGLPYATVNYVPKILATALVAKNRDAFGVARVDALPPVDWVEVRVRKSTSLATLAATIGEDQALLEELNAHLVRGRTPPRKSSFPVRIPRSRADAFARGQAKLEVAWAEEAVHTVREGETLAAIASRFGLSEKELRGKNGVRDAGEVTAGVTLVVPASTTVLASTEAPGPLPLAAVPAMKPGAGERLVFFETTRASTPATIATAFGVPWSRIVAWNDLDPQARLQPGQILQVLVADDFDAAARAVVVREREEVELVARGSKTHLEASLARRGLSRRGYKVRKGDTLEKIGRRFDLSVGDLARINAFTRERDPGIGEVLVVYVDDKHKKGTVAAPAPKTAGAADPESDATAERAEPAQGEEAPVRPPKPKARGRRSPSTAATSRLPGNKSP